MRCFSFERGSCLIRLLTSSVCQSTQSNCLYNTNSRIQYAHLTFSERFDAVRMTRITHKPMTPPKDTPIPACTHGKVPVVWWESVREETETAAVRCPEEPVNGSTASVLISSSIPGWREPSGACSGVTFSKGSEKIPLHICCFRFAALKERGVLEEVRQAMVTMNAGLITPTVNEHHKIERQVHRQGSDTCMQGGIRNTPLEQDRSHATLTKTMDGTHHACAYEPECKRHACAYYYRFLLGKITQHQPRGRGTRLVCSQQHVHGHRHNTFFKQQESRGVPQMHSSSSDLIHYALQYDKWCGAGHTHTRMRANVSNIRH
jgi:hypothetical protein